MPTQLAITLNDDQKARLDTLAQARRASAADVAVEAVTQYLDNDAAFAMPSKWALRLDAGETWPTSRRLPQGCASE